MKTILISLCVILLFIPCVIRPSRDINRLEGHLDPLEGTPQSYVEVVVMTDIARISCYIDLGQMASGEYVYDGAVATSDRSIPMGTKVMIEGFGVMTIEDKTNKRIHKEFGMLTLDIWMTPEDCSKWGLKYRKYKIL